jgi:23S rRNA pseudouridine1911/1915/1917 synthase
MNDPSSRILYCDTACVVINKTAGEAVEGAGKNMTDLPSLLAAWLAASEYPAPTKDALPLPYPVHRIDVPVSGCTVFARNGAALRFLSEQFKNNRVEKLYWAIVEPPENKISFLENSGENNEVIHWLRFDHRKNKSFAYNEPEADCKKAVLRCLRVSKGEKYFFLEIELITGRHHQIRAQLERLGLHIKGDLKYGAKRSESNGGIRLHARSISFPDPAGNGNRITVQAEPPLRDNLWLAFENANLSG